MSNAIEEEWWEFFNVSFNEPSSLLISYKYHLFLKQSVTAFCYDDAFLTDST